MEQKVVLLVEDNFLNRRLSKKVLMENNYKVLEAKNTKEAKELLKKEIIDVVILDINLGENEENGIVLGQLIKEKYAVPFLYLTAYDQSEIINKAIATNPYSYLTKPFKPVELIASIDIIIRQTARKYIPKIKVKDGEYTVELSVDTINYIVSDGNYLRFHTDKNVFKSRSTIKQILDDLSAATFIQVHRAYIVNKNKIQRFSQKSVFINNEEIPLSKTYLETFGS